MRSERLAAIRTEIQTVHDTSSRLIVRSEGRLPAHVTDPHDLCGQASGHQAPGCELDTVKCGQPLPASFTTESFLTCDDRLNDVPGWLPGAS